jgi:hypothetical protein
MPNLTALDALYDVGTTATTDEEALDDLVLFFESYCFPRKQIISSIDNFWLTQIKFNTKSYIKSTRSIPIPAITDQSAVISTAAESPCPSFLSDLSTSNVSLAEVYVPDLMDSPNAQCEGYFQTDEIKPGTAASKLPPLDINPSSTNRLHSPLSPHWQPRHKCTLSATLSIADSVTAGNTKPNKTASRFGNILQAAADVLMADGPVDLATCDAISPSTAPNSPSNGESDKNSAKKRSSWRPSSTPSSPTAMMNKLSFPKGFFNTSPNAS